MSKQETLDVIKETARNSALYLQSRTSVMTADQLYEKEVYIPDFQAILASGNMNEREVGFVCKSSAGRIVKLLQPYDSTIYTSEPEELPAQWSFKWATDPHYAHPFISLSTSPYMIGDVCMEGDKIYKSLNDNNVWAPSAHPTYWKQIDLDGKEIKEETPDTPTEEISDFIQPTGTNDAYKKGAKVKYKGKVYESLIDANVYAPDAYPSGWKEITE